MDDTPPLVGRIAQLNFEEKKHLPHVFRLFAIAMRLYRDHALSYIALAVLPYVLVRMSQAAFLGTLELSTARIVIESLSLLTQLLSALAIIEYARKGDEATVGGALSVGVRQLGRGIALLLVVLLTMCGAALVVVGPLVYLQGQTLAAVATSPLYFTVAFIIAIVVLLAHGMSLYTLVYEEADTHTALLRGLAYDRTSSFAILARLMTLVIAGLGVLLLIIYLGQQLFLIGLISGGQLGLFDEVVTILLLPLFTLYGSALYEVSRVQLGGVSVTSGDKTALGVLIALGLVALTFFFV